MIALIIELEGEVKEAFSYERPLLAKEVTKLWSSTRAQTTDLALPFAA